MSLHILALRNMSTRLPTSPIPTLMRNNIVPSMTTSRVANPLPRTRRTLTSCVHFIINWTKKGMLSRASKMAFQRLVRFHPKSSPSSIIIGQPTDTSIDVGAAAFKGQDIECSVYSGTSVLNPGSVTNKKETIATLLSPLSQSEVGTIRCIGLNYREHADEAGMAYPKVPPIFMKPSTALTGPGTVEIPKLSQVDDCADYESELGVVIGKACKNVSEADAMSYVLGYTACNDVSSRTSQLQGGGGQWSFSKSFDGACPTGPCLVSADLVPDPTKLRVKGTLNNDTVQDCGVDDLIFSIPKLISFLSQSTTLHPGTLIVTGTPSGVGFTKKPKVSLRDGDVFSVEVTPHVGTLVNSFVNEK